MGHFRFYTQCLCENLYSQIYDFFVFFSTKLIPESPSPILNYHLNAETRLYIEGCFLPKKLENALVSEVLIERKEDGPQFITMIENGKD